MGAVSGSTPRSALTLGVHAVTLLPAGVIGAPCAIENLASGDVGPAGDDDHGGGASCVGAPEDDHGENAGPWIGVGHGRGPIVTAVGLNLASLMPG